MITWSNDSNPTAKQKQKGSMIDQAQNSFSLFLQRKQRLILQNQMTQMEKLKVCHTLKYLCT